MTRSTLRFAQVGAFKRKSAADVSRMVSALGEIVAHDLDFLRDREVVNDVINLSDGRDFLAENRSYDVVVLHSILSPKIKMFKPFPRLRVSHRHSIGNWKKRLASTRARYIAVCEHEVATLSGKEIGEIPGYTVLSQRGFLTLYGKADGR